MPRPVRFLAAVAAAALALPAAAVAHVTIAPPFVDDGVPTRIAFQLPNERPPHATIGLTVTAPPGIALGVATAPPGWRAAVDGSQVTWTGGRITGRRTVDFPVRVTARVRAGTVAFLATQRYDDDRTVKWKVALTVLPATGAAAPKQHPWGAVAAGVIGLVVVVLSVVGLRCLRRRPVGDG
jgi:uncharacterized protein YcnI